MFSSLPSRVLPALIALAVSACNPVGNGIGPVRLIINGPTNIPNAATGRIFECVRGPVTATLQFSDGSAGDFTTRVKWTSSNPAVVRVSNGDEPAPPPSTGFFGYGILTPVTPGTATITANYQNLTASIQITVGTPTKITVHTVDPQSLRPVDPAGNSFRIGAGTVQDLTVTALFDNVLTTIDGAATWSFDAPNTAVATIDPGSGLITGVAAGGPLVARAKFSPCSLSASTSVSVVPVQSISITPEFGSDNLFLGNSERMSVFANFGNGPEQDLSLQSTLTSSNTTVGQFSFFSGINILQALAVGGPTNIGATFTAGTTTLTAPAVPVTVVAGTLQSFTVTPATGSVVAGSSEVVSFRATGTYAGGAKQDITRTVGWSSSNTAIGRIISGGSQAGQAFSSGSTPGSTTLTATVSTATPSTATATLTTTAAPTTP
ncbi:MAG: hypothetical protein NVS9B10_19660 [Nevskia sp.]